MRISVVIPTRNRPRDVEKLLPTIAQQTRLPDEVIIVDQSPNHATHAMTAKALAPSLVERSIYIHSSSIRGVSAARNVGIGRSSGDVVVFLDDDVLLTGDCLEQLELAFEANPDYAGIGGVELQMERSALSYIFYYDIFFLGPFRDRKYRISRNWRHLRGLQPVTALKTCVAGFRRDFMTRHHFDERWRSALLEDVELCWRVRRSERFGIWPAASVWHSISEVRTVGGSGYRATGAAWIFFMRSIMKREWPLLPLYAWLWIGLWVNATRRSLASRSIAPAVGLLRGGWSLFKPSLGLPFIDAEAEPFPNRSAPPQPETACEECLRATAVTLSRASADPASSTDAV
jgi:GT2 family glycosyltransferase